MSGWGESEWGESEWGGGGGFNLVAAWASSELTLRLRFDRLPSAEALLPGTYYLTQTGGGLGPTPAVPAVLDARLFTPPDGGAEVELRLASPLGGASVSYVVGVAYTLRSIDGVQIGLFTAVVRGLSTRTTNPALVAQDADPRLVDLDYRFTAERGQLGAGYAVTADGNLVTSSGTDVIRKRVLRRLTTPRGRYAWLQDYGLLPAQSSPASATRLGEYQADAERQILQEPGVSSARVTLQHATGRGALYVTARIKLEQGGELGIGPIPISEG